MKRRYVLALVVIEQVLDGESDGNGAWLNREQMEWSLVDAFKNEKQAHTELETLQRKYALV